MPRQNADTPRFGSSGIRGGLDRVDAAFALRLGRVLANDHKEVLVGHDARLTGPTLTQALIAGLAACGTHVEMAGLVPTPVLAHAARSYDLAVMVTASHNPAPDNGFKLITPQATAPNLRETQAIEEALKTPPAPAPWNATGRVREASGHRERYMDAVMDHLHDQGFEAGSLLDHRIALDCAHGAGATVTPRLLSRLGASISVLGGTPDGRFPDRPSEPTQENLARLTRLVQDGAHTMGAAHDGDADRTVFLADDGRLLRSEQLLVVLARRRGDTRIVMPVDAGALVEKAIPEAKRVITGVGDIHLSRALLEGRATIGAEPSGTWFIGDWSPAPEGPFMAALVAAHLAHDPDLVREAAGLPVPARATRNIPLERPFDPEIMGHLAEALQGRLQDALATTIDGVRMDTPHGWVLVRPSGTEPLMRITAEADTPAQAEQLAQDAANVVHETQRGLTKRRTA